MPPKRKVPEKNGEAPKGSPPKKTKEAEEHIENGSEQKVAPKQKAATGKGRSKGSKPKTTDGPTRRSERSKPEVNYNLNQQLPVEKKKPEKKALTSKTKKPTKEKVEKKQKATKKEKTPKSDSASEDENETQEEESANSIFEFKANSIKGEEISLDKYKGNVCLIVNVASKCGHTKAHYEQLVELYDKYEEQGLRILAFPCNQFGSQEPGNAEKICEFVEKRNVKFDMFDKINVKGKTAHPLYSYLTAQKDGPKGKDIEWNFVKFLVDKEGNFVDRYKPGVKPLEMVDDIEKLL